MPIDDLDFLQELIATPDYVPVFRDKPKPPVVGGQGTTSVFRRFHGVVFNCNDRTDDVRCNKQTNYLWMGNPCCLKHGLDNMQILLDADIEQNFKTGLTEQLPSDWHDDRP